MCGGHGFFKDVWLMCFGCKGTGEDDMKGESYDRGPGTVTVSIKKLNDGEKKPGSITIPFQRVDI